VIIGGPWWGWGYGYPYAYTYPYAYPYAYPYWYPSYYGYPPVVEPPVYVQQPAASANSTYWYYCASAKEYYPKVENCDEDWIKVPPVPE
jgi:hypothetical protein